jgi:hypothetical protein
MCHAGAENQARTMTFFMPRQPLLAGIALPKMIADQTAV